MANLSSITEQIGNAGASLNEFISDNRTTLTAVGSGLAGAALGAGAVVIANKISSNKTKRKKSSSKNKRKRTGRARDRRFISKQKHEVAYQRRRKKAGKKTYGKRYKTRSSKIKYTKKGQPYIILKSGKARFVKKK